MRRAGVPPKRPSPSTGPGRLPNNDPVPVIHVSAANRGLPAPLAPAATAGITPAPLRHSGKAAPSLVVPASVALDLGPAPAGISFAPALRFSQPEIAPDWQVYGHPGGLFQLRHPPGWQPGSSDPASVTFKLPGASWAAVEILEQPMEGQPGDAHSLQALVGIAMSEFASAGEVRLVLKGAWPFSVPGNYVELRTRDRARDLNSRHLLVMAALANGHSALLGLGRTGGLFSQADRILAGQVLATLRLQA